nr:PREDICTED: homeobox protein CDX-2 [Bos mutus]
MKALGYPEPAWGAGPRGRAGILGGAGHLQGPRGASCRAHWGLVALPRPLRILKGQPPVRAAPEGPKASPAPGESGSENSPAPGSPARGGATTAGGLGAVAQVPRTCQLPFLSRRAQGRGHRAHSNAPAAVLMLMRLAGRGMKAGPPFAHGSGELPLIRPVSSQGAFVVVCKGFYLNKVGLRGIKHLRFSGLTLPSSTVKTRTKDKYRVVYTDHQRLELEKEFHYSRYITIRRKAELAATLGLSERQVKIWFQNRRAKERKINKKKLQQQQQQPPPPSGPQPPQPQPGPLRSVPEPLSPVSSLQGSVPGVLGPAGGVLNPTVTQ